MKVAAILCSFGLLFVLASKSPAQTNWKGDWEKLVKAARGKIGVRHNNHYNLWEWPSVEKISQGFDPSNALEERLKAHPLAARSSRHRYSRSEEFLFLLPSYQLV